MDGLKAVSQLALYGVRDCIYGVIAIKQFCSMGGKEKEPAPQPQKKTQPQPRTVFEVLSQCLVFGGLFWLVIFIFHNVIMTHCLRYFNSFLSAEEIASISALPAILGVVFGFTWTLPLFFISRILNYTWYQEIADMTYLNTGGKRRNPFSISYSWGDQIESTAVQFLFLLQGYAVFLLPIPAIINHILSTVHISLLYSLYSFDYKWVQMGWPLRKRLAYIDAKWPYFVGFGLPLAAATTYVGSYIESICIFSTLFPIYVISSTVTFDAKVQNYSWPLRSFGIVTSISDFIFCNICKVIHR